MSQDAPKCSCPKALIIGGEKLSFQIFKFSPNPDKNHWVCVVWQTSLNAGLEDNETILMKLPHQDTR